MIPFETGGALAARCSYSGSRYRTYRHFVPFSCVSAGVLISVGRIRP